MVLAIMDSAYPPARDSLRGQTMTLVAASFAPREEIVETITDWLEDGHHHFAGDQTTDPDDVEDLVDAVIAEHNRIVVSTSDDANALAGVLSDCFDRGIVPVWCEAEERAEAIAEGWEAEDDLAEAGVTLRGFLAATYDEVQRMLSEQSLTIGLDTASDASPRELADEVAEMLAEAGLTVDTSRAADGELTISPIRFELPFRNGDELDDED